MRELGPGEEGEIVVHGPQVFKGYWNRPEENDKAFVEVDGKTFFRTGDIGKYDEKGYFFIIDRIKRMINAAGFKVWPTEVESILYWAKEQMAAYKYPRIVEFVPSLPMSGSGKILWRVLQEEELKKQKQV